MLVGLRGHVVTRSGQSLPKAEKNYIVKISKTAVCLFVCLCACMSQKSHIPTSQRFLYTLTLAMARFSSDDSAVLPPHVWFCHVFT